MNYEKTELKKWIEINDIISFHYFDYVQNFYGIEESHDFWEFVYVDSGELFVIAEQKKILLHSGQGYLHRPWERHNVMTKGIFASVMIFSFSSSSSMLESLAGRTLSFFENEQRELTRILQFGQSFFAPPYDDFTQEKIIWKESIPVVSSQVIKNEIELFFLLFLQQEHAPRNVKSLPGTAQETKEEENLMKMIQVLSDHLYENISLEQLAADVAFSVSYMEKVFRKKLNTTAKDYFHRLKIEQAKKWISEGNDTFTEIAEKLGYGTIHNFSRVFKRYARVSPSAYQKTIKSRGVR